MNAAVAQALKLLAGQSFLYKNLPALKKSYINLRKQIIQRILSYSYKHISSGLRYRGRKKKKKKSTPNYSTSNYQAPITN